MTETFHIYGFGVELSDVELLGVIEELLSGFHQFLATPTVVKKTIATTNIVIPTFVS